MTPIQALTEINEYLPMYKHISQNADGKWWVHAFGEPQLYINCYGILGCTSWFRKDEMGTRINENMNIVCEHPYTHSLHTLEKHIEKPTHTIITPDEECREPIREKDDNN